MYASKLCISNLDLTRVLLNYGPSAGIEEKDLEEGNTPLHWAIIGGVMSPYTVSPLIKVIAAVTLQSRPTRAESTGCLYLAALVP